MIIIRIRLIVTINELTQDVKQQTDIKLMNRLVKNTKKPQTLRFEIDADKLSALFSQQLICAADIRCLDHSSKSCLQTICLKSLLASHS